MTFADLMTRIWAAQSTTEALNVATEHQTDTATPADCPYYRGVGTCMQGGLNCGLHGEPRCITDEPEGGWSHELASPRTEGRGLRPSMKTINASGEVR